MEGIFSARLPSECLTIKCRNQMDQRPDLGHVVHYSAQFNYRSLGPQRGWLRCSPASQGTEIRVQGKVRKSLPGRGYLLACAANQDADSSDQADWTDSSRRDSSGANEGSEDVDSWHRSVARNEDVEDSWQKSSARDSEGVSESSTGGEDDGGKGNNSSDCSLQEWIRYHNQVLDELSAAAQDSRECTQEKVGLGPGSTGGGKILGEGSAAGESDQWRGGGAEGNEDGCPAMDDDEMMEALRSRLQEFVESKDDIADYIADESSEDLLTLEDMERMLSREEAQRLVDDCFRYVIDAFGRMETNLAGLELLAKRRALHRLADSSQLELVTAAEEFIQQLKVAYTRVQLNRSNPLNKEVVRRVNAQLLGKNTNWLMTYSNWERRVETIRSGLGITAVEDFDDKKS